MRILSKSLSVMLLSLAVCSAAVADTLVLSSQDIAHGEFMNKSVEFQGFGCSGGNTSPQLSWTGAPEGTQAYALLVHDPDAPTGSGWWHWQVVNIPANITKLDAGAGQVKSEKLPAGSLQIRNDYGVVGFGGACPPLGHGAHRYQFTIHALSKKLTLPEGASAALTGYMVNAHSLASSTIESLYKR